MSQQWREVRAIVLNRDNHQCRECGQHCGKGDADVHHLVPRAAGGMDEPANLITLCDGCHAARHPNLQGTLARRAIEQWGLRLAKWFDRQGEMKNIDESLGMTLRMLGVDRLRPAQLEVVLAATRGESLLFVSATGSGKSLCFQVPTLHSRGCAFVISPLKALMNQQVSNLTQQKIPATFINGDLAPHDKEIRYAWLRDNAIKFLYCTPERFDSAMVRHSEVEQITRARPSYLVIDEAHCIDRWGKDFRPNYGRLGAVRNALGRPPILAFTATAGRESQQRILQSLGIPDAKVFVTGVDRPNIALARLEIESDYKRFGLVADLLRRMPPGRAMLFVPTVKIGEFVQKRLQSMGWHIPFFHSGFGTANERDTLLGRFAGRIEPDYMAESTVEESQLDDTEKQDALRFRRDGIKEMHKHATNRSACFRKAIVHYFGDTQPIRRKPLAIRILEWVFSRSRKVERALGCCDSCDQVGVDNVVEWAARIWGAEEQRQ